MKKASSKQKVRTTNIVFKRKRMINFIDSTPPKGAFLGRIGRGPLTKNFVIPKELANMLRKKLVNETVILLVLSPLSFFG